MNRLKNIAAVIATAIAFSSPPATAQDSRSLAAERYDEVSGLVADLDGRIDESHRRLAQAQADGNDHAVERLRGQIRALVIRRDSASFEQQLLEIRHGEALSERRSKRQRAASGGIVVDLEAEWRRRRVAEARRAIAADLRNLF